MGLFKIIKIDILFQIFNLFISCGGILMNKLILVVLIMFFCHSTTAFCEDKSNYTIEPNAKIFGALEGRMDIVDALVKFIKAHGNKCDSVSAASDNVFSKGFTLKCNGYRYEYQILDKGGKMYLQVEN